jgi:hypothetical protein
MQISYTKVTPFWLPVDDAGMISVPGGMQVQDGAGMNVIGTEHHRLCMSRPVREDVKAPAQLPHQAPLPCN